MTVSIELGIAVSERARLILQRLLGRIFLIPIGIPVLFCLRYICRYRIENIHETRKAFRKICRENRPLIICANHLTMIDSVILIWALASLPSYFSQYRLLTWNVPAVENYAHKIRHRIFSYLTKCIPIDRVGTSEHIGAVLGKIRWLVARGEVVTIYPEGTRSRSGRIQVESVTYGIGKILQALPSCDVLCLYLRGDRQETYSFYPKRGEHFHLQMERITPSSVHTGRRAIRDLSIQTISKLKEMEDRYFQSKELVSESLELSQAISSH